MRTAKFLICVTTLRYTLQSLHWRLGLLSPAVSTMKHKRWTEICLNYIDRFKANHAISKLHQFCSTFYSIKRSEQRWDGGWSVGNFLFSTYIKQLENGASKKNGGSRKRVDVCRADGGVAGVKYRWKYRIIRALLVDVSLKWLHSRRQKAIKKVQLLTEHGHTHKERAGETKARSKSKGSQWMRKTKCEGEWGAEKRLPRTYYTWRDDKMLHTIQRLYPNLCVPPSIPIAENTKRNLHQRN